MKLSTTLLALFLTTGIAGGAHAQKQEQPQTAMNTKEVSDIAARGLATLNKLVTEQNYKDMGFETAAEVRSAAVGQPLPVFMVQLDELRNYKPGNDPNGLLKALDKALIPVTVNGRARSSITVEKGKDGGWKTTGFGSPKLAKSLARAQASGGVSGAPFIVHVAALNTFYLGHRAGGKLMLTALADDRFLKVTAGKTMPADDVFKALAPVAQQYNGLPL